MKNSIFFAFVVAFTLQNANAIDSIFVQSSPGVRNFMVLWQGQFKKDSKLSRIYSDYAQIDSVLLGPLDNSKKWFTSAYADRCTQIKLNTNYLVLSQATELDTFKNLYGDCKDILSDTPENRKKLSKKWNETVVVNKFANKLEPAKRKASILEEKKSFDSAYEYVVIKATVKSLDFINEETNIKADAIQPDTVLLGKIPFKGSYWLYSPDLCPNVAAGEYLVLLKAGESGPVMWGKCPPLKDTPENRKKLTEEWEKCQTWAKTPNRQPPPDGQFCGEK